jgi:hypothetical protein
MLQEECTTQEIWFVPQGDWFGLKVGSQRERSKYIGVRAPAEEPATMCGNIKYIK